MDYYTHFLCSLLGSLLKLAGEISKYQLKLISPIGAYVLHDLTQKLNMHITGMGRSFRSIAQLNALQITQLI